MCPRRKFAGRRRFDARKQLDERGFSRAVHAHQRDAVSAADREIDALEYLLLAVAFGHALKLRHHAPARRRLRKRKVDGLFLGGQLDSFDLVELLDPALHLLGLGGLVAEAVDERFEVMDAVLLVAVGGLQLGAALGLLREVAVVVAGVEIGAAVPDFRNLFTVASRK